MPDLVERLRDRAYSFRIVDRLCVEAADEIARLRLTDDDRKAISRIYDLLSERSRELQAARRIEESTPYVQLAKTLQTMWERLK